MNTISLYVLLAARKKKKTAEPDESSRCRTANFYNLCYLFVVNLPKLIIITGAWSKDGLDSGLWTRLCWRCAGARLSPSIPGQAKISDYFRPVRGTTGFSILTVLPNDLPLPSRDAICRTVSTREHGLLELTCSSRSSLHGGCAGWHSNHLETPRLGPPRNLGTMVYSDNGLCSGWGSSLIVNESLYCLANSDACFKGLARTKLRPHAVARGTNATASPRSWHCFIADMKRP